MNAVHFNDADLNLIKVLDALVREVSVARAARRLGVTPSAISHALGRLRLMLRDPVVVRSGRSLRLTPRALALAPVAASMCEAARGLLTDAPDTDPRKWQDTLRILGSDYALAAWIFPALALARTEAPGLRVAAISLESAEWERQLIDGAADFALRGPTAQKFQVTMHHPGPGALCRRHAPGSPAQPRSTRSGPVLRGRTRAGFRHRRRLSRSGGRRA